MTESNFSSIYSDGSYLSKHPDWDVAFCPWKAQQIVSILSKHSVRPKTLCEVGCGSGAILTELSGSFPDCQFFGYDISKDAIAMAKQRSSPSIEFAVKDIACVSPGLDVIVAVDVVEHVEDYYGFLRAMREKAEYKVIFFPLDLTVSALLRGKLISQRNLCGHIHYFTKNTALAALKDTGYEIIDHYYPKTWEIYRGSQSTLQKAATVARRVMHGISPDFASLTVGGYALMVLAKG